MNAKPHKKWISLLIGALPAALAFNAAAAVVVTDTFDVPAGTVQEFNLQANQAARQAGSAVGITYSDASAVINASTQVYLTQTEAHDSAGVLTLRNLIKAAGTVQIAASGAEINEDLAPQLAGKQYTFSYTGLMIDRLGNVAGNASVESWYQGFSLGGSNPYEPSHPNTDLGFSVYQNNVALIHTDGTLRWAGAVPGLSVGSEYDVQIDVDETAGTASIRMDAGGTVTDLGTYTVGFEAGDLTRNVRFNNRIVTLDTLPAGGGAWDIQVDAQINDLLIETFSGDSSKINLYIMQ